MGRSTCSDHRPAAADLFTAWCLADAQGERAEISPHEAARLKVAVFALMVDAGLEPEDVLEGALLDLGDFRDVP